MLPVWSGVRVWRHMATPRALWTLADLVDFEVLLAQDERDLEDAGAEGRLQARDRALYRQIQGAPTSHRAEGALEKPGRRWLFHRWRQARLEQQGLEPGTSPGASFAAALALSGWLLGGAGFLVGKGVLWVGLTGGRLAGGPTEPVNVLFLLLTCVAPPFLLSMATAYLLVAAGNRRWPSAPPVLRSLFAVICRPLVRWLIERFQHAIPVERRVALGATVGLLRSRTTAHGAALGWPLVGLMQWFALGFATAIAAGCLLSVQIWHQTFAWQTTVDAYTPARVHGAVRVVATPWSWLLGEGQGYPTLAQVTATQYHRHRDPAALPADAASSWWVFVVLTALTYAFLPRLLLLLAFRFRQRSALDREQFVALRYDALYERLVTTAVAWRGPDAAVAPAACDGGSVPGGAAGEGPVEPATGPCVLVVPADLDRPQLRERVAEVLASWKGWRPATVVDFEGTMAGQEACLARVGGQGGQVPRRVLVLQEAFMPPTREVLEFLRGLRRVVGPAGAILVGLLGKPGADPLGRPAQAADVQVWRKRAQSLGDPNLAAEALPGA